MTAKHTPGPWLVDYAQGDMPYIVADQGKQWDNPTICDLYEDVTPEDSVTIGAWLKPYENAQANARLIASAPELLELAKEALVQLDKMDFSCSINWNGSIKTNIALLLNSAIAKAEGTPTLAEIKAKNEEARVAQNKKIAGGGNNEKAH